MTEEKPAEEMGIIALPKDDIRILQSIPYKNRQEVEKNIHDYIQQVGRDYGVRPKETART